MPALPAPFVQEMNPTREDPSYTHLARFILSITSRTSTSLTAGTQLPAIHCWIYDQQKHCTLQRHNSVPARTRRQIWQLSSGLCQFSTRQHFTIPTAIRPRNTLVATDVHCRLHRAVIYAPVHLAARGRMTVVIIAAADQMHIHRKAVVVDAVTD